MCALYFVIGYIVGFAFTLLLSKVTNEDLTDSDGCPLSYILWPAVLPVFLLFLISKFIKSFYNGFHK